MNVPLVDLAAQHAEVAEAVAAGFARVIETTSFVLGPDVHEFELEYARFSGAANCVAVANGTDALELPLRALGIGPGDEVIIPVNTFIATAEAVVRTGAKPVFVDVDETHLLMDPFLIDDVCTTATRAVIPVHLYGQMASCEVIARIADDVGIYVIEDAAQAQGASRNGRPAGQFGVMAGTSFYPGKNLGAYGDAGAILMTSEHLAARLRAMRDHGSTLKYRHTEAGGNSRMDTLQAVVLRAKLHHLARWNDARRAAAQYYDELLTEFDNVVRPSVLAGNEHVWHLYVIRLDNRAGVLDTLHEDGIGAGVHYPVPLHLQPVFRSLGYEAGAFPVAERAADEILSLPLHPHITRAQQERVVASLKRAR